MKKILLLVFLLTLQSGFAQTLIPYPQFYVQKEDSFIINSSTMILIGDESFRSEAAWLSEFIQMTTGISLEVQKYTGAFPEAPCILVAFDASAKRPKPDEYKLNISPGSIIISASTKSGIFYGMQTLRQLLPVDLEVRKPIDKVINLELKCCEIYDYPSFQWRGMLLDCCRHFMEKDFIKRYLDLLALHKMNKFHWHLTEDQGWRIEIKKYPLLTQVGGFRKEKDGSIYGGFYTQEDIKEIIAYATERNIDIIPEIEMPGHSLAALASYPEYSCTGGPFEVLNDWGTVKDVYCPGNENTFKFLENVLSEVIDLFPYQYVHIGGDEVPKYRWENCPKCQKLMKEENLKNPDELQSYFIKRIEKFINSKGKKLIGWDEILDGGLSPNATVQSWRGMEGGIKSAKAGHYVIMSPTSHCYFDYGVKSIDLQKVYSFNPIPAELNSDEAKFILGGECNMWTEYAPQKLIDSKIFPRILAMSEVLWTNPITRNYDNFNERVQDYYKRMDLLGIKYGYESVPVKFSETYSESEKCFYVTILPGQSNIDLEYVISGEPDKSIYKEPIKICSEQTIYVLVKGTKFIDTNVYLRSYTINEAIGKEIKITNLYSKYYTAGGINGLINGIQGSTDFRDGNWQGYSGVDMEVIIDLGKEKPISEISAGFLQSTPSWIFMPDYVEYLVSNDGKQFTSISKALNDVSQKNPANTIKRFEANISKLSARYIKVFAKNIGKCPDWHEGAGEESWIFCDEVVIK